MSDFNSSLPIRTQTNGDVAVKVTDGTITARVLTVNTDGSVNITDNGASLTVDAVNLDIRDLSSATDSVAITDGGGTITVDATLLDIRHLTFANDKVDASGSSVAVSNFAAAANFDIRNLTQTRDQVKIGDGTDTMLVNTDGSINVVITDSTPGTQVNNYNTAAAVAAAASSTHTYTSTGNFYLTQIEASNSGKMKIEVQVNGVTVFVKFTTAAYPNSTIELTQPPLVATTQTVTVIRTNLESSSQDLYSTICGYIA